MITLLGAYRDFSTCDHNFTFPAPAPPFILPLEERSKKDTLSRGAASSPAAQDNSQTKGLIHLAQSFSASHGAGVFISPESPRSFARVLRPTMRGNLLPDSSRRT